MPMIHADGFDQWGVPAQMASAYNDISNINLIDDGTARTGRYYVKHYGAQLEWLFNVPEKQAVIGCGIRCHTFASVPLGPIGVGLDNGDQIFASIDSNLAINITSHNGGTLATGNPKAVDYESWYWWEIKVLLDNPGNPFVEVRINGAPVLSYTGPAIAAGAHINSYQSMGSGAYGSWDLDDLVVCSGDAVYPGDRHCLVLYPNADDAGNQWTVNGGVSGNACLSAVPPVDANFIEGINTGDVSTFDLPPIPAGVASILGVVLWSRSQKSDAGDCNIQPGFIVGAGQANGQDRPASDGSFIWSEDIIFENPLTGAPYTPAELASSKVTIKRTV